MKLEKDAAVPLASGIKFKTRVVLEIDVRLLKPARIANPMRYDLYESAPVSSNAAKTSMGNPIIIVFLGPILSAKIPPRNEPRILTNPVIENNMAISFCDIRSGGSERLSEIIGCMPW